MPPPLLGKSLVNECNHSSLLNVMLLTNCPLDICGVKTKVCTIINGGGATITGPFDKLGCCNTDNIFTGSPGLPYIYGAHACCIDGDTPKIFDFVFQNCCGPDSYDDGRFSSSLDNEGGAQLYTYSEEFCCENPGGTPALGNFKTQGCCGDQGLGLGGTLFTYTEEFCCNGKVFEWSGNTRCCNNKEYDSRSSGCCNGMIYSRSTQGCCDGVIYNRITERCCNEKEIYNENTGICCDVKQCEITEDVIDIDDLGKKGPPVCPTVDVGGKKGDE